MTDKRKKRTRKGKGAQPVDPNKLNVVFRFKDGSTHSMPLVDHEVLQDSQRAQHAEKSPEGKRLMRERAEQNLIAHRDQELEMRRQESQAESNKENAQQLRFSSRSELKQKIEKLMRRYRGDDTTFTSFMAAWNNEPLDQLILTRIGGVATKTQEQSFSVMDDSGGNEEEPRPYKYSTLIKMYSKCRPQ